MIAKVFIFLIRVYQVLLSPLVGRACRFHPSCSNYCLESIRRFGAWRGVWLGIKRIARCHPWNPGGFDPVPESTTDDGSMTHPTNVPERHCI